MKADRIKNNDISLGRCFLAGGLLGALIYICVYGVATLDVTYVDWLYAKRAGGDPYLYQFSWEFFRYDDWRFPIGNLDTILYGIGGGVNLPGRNTHICSLF